MEKKPLVCLLKYNFRIISKKYSWKNSYFEKLLAKACNLTTKGICSWDYYFKAQGLICAPVGTTLLHESSYSDLIMTIKISCEAEWYSTEEWLKKVTLWKKQKFSWKIF